MQGSDGVPMLRGGAILSADHSLGGLAETDPEKIRYRKARREPVLVEHVTLHVVFLLEFCPFPWMLADDRGRASVTVADPRSLRLSIRIGHYSKRTTCGPADPPSAAVPVGDHDNNCGGNPSWTSLSRHPPIRALPLIATLGGKAAPNQHLASSEARGLFPRLRSHFKSVEPSNCEEAYA
jgi:hypothetical protein